MNVSHVRVGDLVVDSGGSSFTTCNCACQRCLDGSCCQFPDPNPAPRGWTTTTISTAVPTMVITCGAIDHDYAVLDPARLFCRKCGTTRAV